MKTLYFDCGMGAAGDMLTAALLELVPDREAALAELNALGIPGVTFTAQPSVRCGITGTHVSVSVNGEEESEELHGHHHDHEHDHEHEHDHDHEHEHHHHHHHSGMGDIAHIVSHLPLSERVRHDVLAVYGRIAEAESHAHGVPVEEIHFHEVGTMDAVADVTAVCLLMEKLSPDRVLASPVHVGCGQVRCAHGILPVPAPATEYILRGVPVYGGSIRGELCTPTGAALLRHFVTEFGAMPVMRVEKTGCGMGTKDFEMANCVRAMLGESGTANCVRAMMGESGDASSDDVLELACNLDDMTGEEIGFACEILRESGALEVWTTPIQMKKSRPGVLLSVLCRPADRDALVQLLLRHTSTLGVRETRWSRTVLARQVETVDGIRRKTASGYGVSREKIEYDDLARYARERGLTLREARALLEK